MIPYQKSFLGISLIFRFHGSPIWRAFIPAIISTVLFLVLNLYVGYDGREDKFVSHPYGIGVLISSVSFLIVFRANYGYQRYWNACGDVHQFLSKVLDAITHTGCYHLQQSHFDRIKPPSYFDSFDLNRFGLSRDREKEDEVVNKSTHRDYKKCRAVVKSIELVNSQETMKSQRRVIDETTHVSGYLIGSGRMDGGWGVLFDDETSTFYNIRQPNSWLDDDNRGFACTKGGRTPSLFLQELLHLSSLFVAVSFATLRNDIDGAQSPLDFYIPGAPWPKVDPDEGKPLIKKVKDGLRYLTGFDKTPATRTRANAKRPLPVIGGVSDSEIAFLQKARGPSAKVNLAFHWLSEFIIREHLAGSLGNVGPPIISRIFQFLSDGMVCYNHARKTMFIPFPFPHAQISAFFVFTIMFAVPFLMLEYTSSTWLGALLTYLTVTCLAGLHEVARELENPFRNEPNEIPLCTLMAMYNESLLVNYSGYHPDHFWDADKFRDEVNDTYSNSSSLGSNSVAEGPQAPLEKSKSDDSSDKILRLKELQAIVHQPQREIERLIKLIQK